MTEPESEPAVIYDPPVRTDEPLSVFERLHVLEVGAEVQGEILTKLHEMLLEQDRLTESIGRLGEGAGSLSAALLQVDKQQQVLAQMNQHLDEVEAKTVTRDELQVVERSRAQESLHFRKQVLRRIFATTLAIVSLLVVAGLVFLGVLQSRQSAVKTVCEARTEQNLIIIDVLERSLADVPPGPRTEQVQADIERFRALNTDCEGL